MRFDLKLLDFVDCQIDGDKLAVCGSDRDLTWTEFKKRLKILNKRF